VSHENPWPFGNPAASYNTNSAQSIPNNTTTVVNFEDRVIDNYDAVVVGAGWKFFPPNPGIYFVSASIIFDDADWTVGERVQLSIRRNGLTVFQNRMPAWATFTERLGVQVTGLVRLASNENVDIVVNQNQGAAVALQPSAIQNFVTIDQRA